MVEIQTILSVEMDECVETGMSFKALRGIIREYTGEELPVCPDVQDPVSFYHEETGNPMLLTEDLNCGEIRGEQKRGVQIGSLLLVISEENGCADEWTLTSPILSFLSVYLLPDTSTFNTPAKEKVVTKIDDLDLIGQVVRTRIWIEEDPDNQYFSVPPEEGVQMWTEEEARVFFVFGFQIALSSAIHPWGFSTQVGDLGPDPIDVDVVVFWDGDGTAIIRLRKEGCENITLINTDCKKDYGWKKIGVNDV